MSEKRIFVLAHRQARASVAHFAYNAPEGWMAVFSEPTRNLEQNAAQWPILDAFSKQIQWPVNGVMCWLTEEEWKDVLTAAFEKDTNPRLAAGLNGGIVMLGRRTSKFSKSKFSDWLEFLHAVAATKGVNLQPN
jgi:hypothetical protein